MFNFHIFLWVPDFLMLLICSCIPDRSEKILYMISIFLNVLTQVLLVTHGLSYNRFFGYIRKKIIFFCPWVVYSIYICYVYLLYRFIYIFNFLLVFCLAVLSSSEYGILYPPTVIFELLVSFLNSVFLSHIFWTLLSGAYIFTINIFFINLYLY